VYAELVEKPLRRGSRRSSGRLRAAASRNDKPRDFSALAGGPACPERSASQARDYAEKLDGRGSLA
jgi:hypothetical protein